MISGSEACDLAPHANVVLEDLFTRSRTASRSHAAAASQKAAARRHLMMRGPGPACRPGLTRHPLGHSAGKLERFTDSLSNVRAFRPTVVIGLIE
jgi:hypothetical protein